MALTRRRKVIAAVATAAALAGGGLVASNVGDNGGGIPNTVTKISPTAFTGDRVATTGPCAKLGLREQVIQGRVQRGCLHGGDPDLKTGPPPTLPPNAPPPRMVKAGDPVPQKPSVANIEDPAKLTAALATPATITCDGDGTTGRRVQVVYAHASGDDSGNAYPLINQAISLTEDMFRESGQASGGDGSRIPRWVTTPGCTSLSILNFPLTDASSFESVTAQLKAQGHARQDRYYTIFVDSSNFPYCGIGELYGDEQPGPGNVVNTGPIYSMNQQSCWITNGQNIVAAHELGHNMGAVHNSAPNSDGGGHCGDGLETMCYPGGPRGNYRGDVCPQSHQNLYDCNNDDYFSAQHFGYLSTHWNLYDNAFLIGGAGNPVYQFTCGPTSQTSANGFTLRGSTTDPAPGSTAYFDYRVAGAETFDNFITDPNGTPWIASTAGLGLAFNTMYEYRVVWPSATGGTQQSNICSFTTGNGVTTTTIPPTTTTVTVPNPPVPGSPTGGTVKYIQPVRIVDTRTGEGNGVNSYAGASIPALTEYQFQIGGPLGGSAQQYVPLGAKAMLAVVTVTNTTGAAGFLTAWPTGDPRPLASMVNWAPGETKADGVVVKIAAGGLVSFYNGAAATVDVIVDLMGYVS